MKIVLVFGTRPEAIKMAPIISELKKYPKLQYVVCVTAQHRAMLDQVLEIFDISPDYDLDIMGKDQDLFDVTKSVLIGVKSVLEKEKPDLILVQGDTTTALTSGLAAYYFKIPIGHIEAGLRTYNKYSPFPEEKNRHILSVLADYHFAPTELAKTNLIKEGISEDKIWVTGNTVIDALLAVIKNQNSDLIQEKFEKYFEQRFNLSLIAGKDKGNKYSKLILVTGHRRENFGEGFKNICYALKEIAEKRQDIDIVYPVHLNPNVQQPVKAILNGTLNVHLIEPLEYELFVFLMKRAYLVLTDSGGIQEEAPSLGIPVLVMRNNTERPEGIAVGTVKMVGTDRKEIVNKTLELINNSLLYEEMSKTVNPYGDGYSSERIVKIINQLV
jgi:UDP-N-acetylglucosamine 2-epimerase (non-hydrolysing)